MNYLLFNNGYHTIHHMKPGVHGPSRNSDELVACCTSTPTFKPSIVGYAIDAHFMGKPRVNYTARVHRPRPQRRGGRRDWFTSRRRSTPPRQLRRWLEEDQKEALVKDGKRPLKAA